MTLNTSAIRANPKISVKKTRSIPLNVSYAQTAVCFFFFKPEIAIFNPSNLIKTEK